MDEERVLQLLESRGIVESVMQSLQLDGKRERKGEVGRRGDREEDMGADDDTTKEGERGCVCEEVRLEKMVEEVSERLDQRTGEEVPKRGIYIYLHMSYVYYIEV